MLKPRFLLSFVFGMLALSGTPARSQTGDAAKGVMAAEEARTTALDHSDVAALEKIMADDVTYIHASGKVDTKKSYLDAIRSGQLHYISWTPINLQVRLVGNDGAAISGEYAGG